ncbi:MAG: hypothetical protein EHM28_09125 [Spirochaetaceae bacterium]|nr:MAG: hypothetical protein EHM28_09125 [Spirochaetaceae bacterium]
MKKNHSKSIFALAIAVIGLFSCDFLSQTGSMGGMALVRIPLVEDEGSRAISKSFIPAGISITGFTINVFGPGMEPMTKYVSRGAKVVDFYVPAGRDRHFTLEVHFYITDYNLFPYANIRSFKGREIADLKAGSFVGLTMDMVAGATDLIVVDNQNTTVWAGESILWSDTATTEVSFSTDVDIAPDGTLIIAKAGDMTADQIFYTTGISDAGGFDAVAGYFDAGCRVRSLAIDRQRGILYFSSDDNPAQFYRALILSEDPVEIQKPSLLPAGSIASVEGMAVDTWDGKLYIAGTRTFGAFSIAALVKYDPVLEVVEDFESKTTCQQIKNLRDVIVKDNGVFVLNVADLADPQFPSILKFNRNLDYQGGYGALSRDGTTFKPSMLAGAFYFPKRFFAHENSGLYVIDDSAIQDDFDHDWDKLVYVNENFSSSSWQAFPSSIGIRGETLDPFEFFE